MLFLLLASVAAPARAAIVVDGKLDEPEWQDAQHVSGFLTTVPDTHAEPALATDVLVYTDADGIHIGFVCDQPSSVARTRSRSTRDQDVEADRVSVMIDFEGRGNTAYEFTVSISDGIRDAIIGNTLIEDAEGHETRFNTDWDGVWSHAVSETGSQWFVEIRLPWRVAPMGAEQDGAFSFGIFASRVVSALGERYSSPANQLDRATFLADMQPITVKSYASRELDLFPYAAATRDFHDPGWGSRIGADVYWKPLPQHQVTATFNPDFGQVESDLLVVNFSAIPTFFPEKRPFFTENQSLFDTDTRLVYTRRIGAAPDAGGGDSSDIIGAAKYTGSTGRWDYGAIAAVEDRSSQARGRDFYVGRVRTQVSENLSAGWLGTHVERPALDRTADVDGLDFAWTLQPGVTLRGQGEFSDVRRPSGESGTPLDPTGTGNGATLGFLYSPGGAWSHAINLTHFSDRFCIDDAGFLERNDLDQVAGTTAYTWRMPAAGGGVRESSITANLVGSTNDRGRQLPALVDLYWETKAPDTRGLSLEYGIADIGGADDRVTRGNGPVRFPSQSSVDLGYNNPQTGLFRYTAVARAVQGVFSGWGYGATWIGELHLSERLIIRTHLDYTALTDFVIWQHDDVLASFRYREIFATTGVDWFPDSRQEFRVLFQWSAGRGGVLQAYRPDARGSLHATGDDVSSFSFSQVPLQIRYRYEFAPLSDLYLVYSRGGEVDDEERRRPFGTLFDESWRHQTSSQFLVEGRYRFSLL